MQTQLILEKLYGIRPRRPRRRVLWALARGIRSARIGWRQLIWRLRGYNFHISLAAVALALWLATHIYYYNELTMLEFGVKVAWAQVEAGQEKRNHIQRNLRALLHYYAEYERKTIGDITELRTGSDKPDPGAAPSEGEDGSIESLLGRLSVVAEQYPNLHLTNTVRQFSSAVVNSETEVTQRIMAYNTAVNIYTSVLAQFPGMLFAVVMGFESYDFYSPEDRKVLDYRELKL